MQQPSNSLVLRAVASAVLFAAASTLARPARAQTVGDAADAEYQCDEGRVYGLSQQLLATQMCLSPGVFVPFAPHGNISLSSGHIFAYLSAPARDALWAASNSLNIQINSAFRTIADQYVLYYSGSCNLVASPGTSNHETGRAVDVQNWDDALDAMRNAGCSHPYPGNDDVHFDCPGPDLRADSIRAFQHLWNVNHPGDQIDEDGGYGPITASRLRASPAGGFPLSGCEPDDDGDGTPRSRDCNDHDAAIHPGAAERCNNVDDNCNGQIDESLSRVCGTNVGDCHEGAETCTAGTWGACLGSVAPIAERCDSHDNNCDGMVDEGRICEREEAAYEPGFAGGSSDIDGDGRADACIRTPQGFRCLLASGRGFSVAVPGPALPDAEGYGDPLVAALVRMGDLDGDGRAEVCAVASDALRCWRMDPRGNDQLMLTVPTPRGLTNFLLADVDGDRRADVCTRSSEGLQCSLSGDAGVSRGMTLEALSDAEGFDDVLRYGTLRMGDLDGDGRDDVCVRLAQGIRCWHSTPGGFGPPFAGPLWSDDSGFGALAVWSTLRLADVDGDRRADLCVRLPDDNFICYAGGAQGFGALLRGPTLAAADGWDQASSYATLRLADLNGDGALDLCGRSDQGIRCWLWTGTAFDTQLVGPALSDADGWNAIPYFRSLRLADVTGDGRADLCARAPDGLRCYESSGQGFSNLWITEQWRDSDGFDDLARVASLRIAGGRGTASSARTVRGCACAAPGRPRATPLRALLALAVAASALAARRRLARRHTR